MVRISGWVGGPPFSSSCFSLFFDEQDLLSKVKVSISGVGGRSTFSFSSYFHFVANRDVRSSLSVSCFPYLLQVANLTRVLLYHKPLHAIAT